MSATILSNRLWKLYLKFRVKKNIYVNMAGQTQSYNENIISAPQVKFIESTRKHQTTKQIFGEIKNVIHNQNVATPLKLDQTASKIQASKYSSYTDARNKQLKYESKSVNNPKILKTKYANSSNNDISFLDYFDFRGQCCSSARKSDQQIWSEMNLFDDSFLNKIIDFDRQHQDEDIVCEIPEQKADDYTDDPEIIDVKDEFNFNYWPDAKALSGDTDLISYLERPDDIYFEF